MLVLTRKTQQKIQIGPNIVVTILQVKGQSVRVGIEAPREVCVLRTELSDAPAESQTEIGDMQGAASEAVSPRPLGMIAHKLRCRASGAAPAPLSRHLERTGPASRRTPCQPVASQVATATARTVGC